MLIVLCLFPLWSSAQSETDTLNIMHYNVLNYRNITSFCTVNNNSPASKEGYMNTIVGYAMPDIITVNELAGDGGTAAKRLLDNALNKDGRKYYKQCTYNANSNLCNMLYYNQNKLVLYKQDKIERAVNNSFLVRLIDVYTLYYLDEKKLAQGDTTFMVFYVGHLKAGSSSSDKDERADATEAIMKYHEERYDRTNYFICGDFNIQTSSEECYQNLIAHSNTALRFHDPLGRNASWNNNGTYAFLHTQSTRSSSNGCASSGGLDDRFDFILCGQEVLENDYGVGYIAGSYNALGNDSKHFNQSIISSSNTSVPATVLSALYNMSDHLPVVMKVGVGRSLSSARDLGIDNYLILNNPVVDRLNWKLQAPTEGSLEIRDMQGKLVYAQAIDPTSAWQSSDLRSLVQGTYTVTFRTQSGASLHRKIVKM